MVLEGFWEAKILDFCTFFDVFSMQNLDRNLEGQKSKKKATKSHFSASWRRVGGGPQAPGERKREGCKSLQSKNLSLPSGAWPFVITLELWLTAM